MDRESEVAVDIGGKLLVYKVIQGHYCLTSFLISCTMYLSHLCDTGDLQ